MTGDDAMYTLYAFVVGPLEVRVLPSVIHTQSRRNVMLHEEKATSYVARVASPDCVAVTSLYEKMYALADFTDSVLEVQ